MPGWVPGAPQGEQPGHHVDVPSLPPGATFHASARSADHVDEDLARPFKVPRVALHSTLDIQPFADVLPDSAGLSLPMPSPVASSLACQLLDSLLAPTGDDNAQHDASAFGCSVEPNTTRPSSPVFALLEPAAHGSNATAPPAGILKEAAVLLAAHTHGLSADEALHGSSIKLLPLDAEHLSPSVADEPCFRHMPATTLQTCSSAPMPGAPNDANDDSAQHDAVVDCYQLLSGSQARANGADCLPPATCAPAKVGHLLPSPPTGSLMQNSHIVPLPADAQHDRLFDADAARPSKIQKRATSKLSDSLLYADEGASTGHSFHQCAPRTPSPAIHLVLTDASVQSCGRPSPVTSAPEASHSQVCMQFRSISPCSLSRLSGIELDLSVVQSMASSAVAGNSSGSRSNFVLGSSQSVTDAPNSDFGLLSPATPTMLARHFATLPCSPSLSAAATARPPGRATSPPSSAPSSNLASATARLPGSPFACASPSPLPPLVPASAALPVSTVFFGSGPSKRRLLFVPGPKLAKRLKLG